MIPGTHVYLAVTRAELDAMIGWAQRAGVGCDGESPEPAETALMKLEFVRERAEEAAR